MFQEHPLAGLTKKGCFSPKSNSRCWESLGSAQQICKEMFIKVLTRLAVLTREQVVGERGCVRQALQDGVEEARIAQVVESRSSSLSLLPVHAKLLRGKEDPFWQSHSLGNGCGEMTFEKRDYIVAQKHI